MFITKELLLHEDISIQVTTKDYYQIIEVFLVLRIIQKDKQKEFKFRLHEPYERLTNAVLDCKEYGVEIE